MVNIGIMEEIRSLLSQGRTSREVIALGYKPPTVYKVQRQLRKGRLESGRPILPATHQEPMFRIYLDQTDPVENKGTESEQWLAVDRPSETESLRAELEQARLRIAELEMKAKEDYALQEKVKTLEVEAEVADALREQVQKLEGQLEHAAHTQAAMRRSSVEWQINSLGEQSARQEAERRAEEYHEHISRWQQENQALQAQFDGAQQLIVNLYNELQELQPLKTWAGHPCSVCRQPMSGSVDRALAAQLTKDLAHKACLEKPGSGWGKLLLAGGALYGLSKLGKR